MAYIVPGIIAAIVIFALAAKKSAYDMFLEGAEDGMKIAARIYPPLLAMLVAAAMLRESGAMDMLCSAAAPLADFFGIPHGVMPLIALRPVSGSGSLGLLSDILSRFGPDSIEGRLASVICASTETTFYCVMIYFAGVRSKNAIRALPAAIAGDIAGIIAAAAAVRIMM
ncbi:MAG: spore maturation protein [Clostridiales bacterium]|nr:spore maturation protein [Clostridiales bacterium]